MQVAALGRSKWWFNSLIGVVNLAVGLMFYVITIRPIPPVTYTAPAVRPTPPDRRVIPATTGTPTRITIPSLAIDLNVSVGSYNPTNQSWTIGSTNAYYADPSLPVNDSNGRTLIYGHAQPQVFGRLPNIQTGAKAQVYTDNGYVFDYSFQSMRAVVPTDSSIFTSAGPPTLVLQTCTGDWDAYRALYSFGLTSKEKA
ncbi:MAG: class F sortase [Candidatus Saccharibacteria bacterium]